MFERFSDRARQVVIDAQDEARVLNHNYIGTEHILLGLLREEGGAAPARALGAFDVTLEEVRAQVTRIVGRGDELATGQIPFTPRAKKVLELSLREALNIGDNYIRTEHILLGLLRERQGVAARILLDFAQLDAIRETLLEYHGVLPPHERGRFKPESPPLAAEVVEEIGRVRNAKERAIEDQEFDRAAELRDRERRLTTAARNLQRAWADEEPAPFAGRSHSVRSGTMPGRFSEYGVPPPLLAGWVLFGLALGVGLLIGWAIWG